MTKRKSQQELLKDAFTKTVDQRYAESSKGEKITYWISLGIACGIILYVLLK
ncbi:hypothetical protein [Massilia pseudoviolaceinigra]|uniref:hypothetical protein n=1 Tax=Massilia pseudoviolaceinigra TaxID=3057165 RepID=UPI002796A414|nr:hypothetical protein [Massilia sp. CCM 9206]MDQ1925092.1 hypothetical protein [Massilia sp. CCM 9206]